MIKITMPIDWGYVYLGGEFSEDGQEDREEFPSDPNLGQVLQQVVLQHHSVLLY